MDISIFVLYINTFSNPLYYFIMVKDIRKELVKLFYCGCRNIMGGRGGGRGGGGRGEHHIYSVSGSSSTGFANIT